MLVLLCRSGRCVSGCSAWVSPRLTQVSVTIREVHDNTLKGLWTGLRNFLRPFRGVNKKYLHQYVALFERGSNVKRATVEFLHALLGVRHPTSCPT